MKLMLAISIAIFVFNFVDCIGGGSWSEGKRAAVTSDANFAKIIAEDFRQLKSKEEKLQLLRKMCKDILELQSLIQILA